MVVPVVRERISAVVDVTMDPNRVAGVSPKSHRIMVEAYLATVDLGRERTDDGESHALVLAHFLPVMIAEDEVFLALESVQNLCLELLLAVLEPTEEVAKVEDLVVVTDDGIPFLDHVLVMIEHDLTLRSQLLDLLMSPGVFYDVVMEEVGI